MQRASSGGSPKQILGQPVPELREAEERAAQLVAGENAMVALALLVAESNPGQKDLMIRLILNLLSSGRET